MATVTKGRAEGAALEHKHERGKAPVQTRSERPRATERDAFPAVTGREVDWKYTPVARLDALLNGELDGSAQPIAAETIDGVTVAWLPVADASRGRAGLPEDRSSANAWQSVREVLSITVAREAEVAWTLRRDGLGGAARAAHTVIEVGAAAHATIVIDNVGEALLAENLELVVGDDATLTLVSVQEWADDAIHLASHFATIGRGATLKHISVSLGGGIVRVNPSAHLTGEGGGVELSGVYFADAGQHIEHQVYVNHDAPTTRSRVNYKGALNGDGAHTVWIGDVLIGQKAVGTDSYEQNRNLVLSEGTRADSVPNLEIETGDIEGAGHASATGRFDEEQLFYLQARGIPETEARRLVVLGFLVEVLHQVPGEQLRDRLIAAVEAELEGAR